MVGVATTVAPVVGGLIAKYIGYKFLFGTAFGLGLIAFGLLRWWVLEPRLPTETLKLSATEP